MDADRLTSNLADVSVDWTKHIAANDYSFVATYGAGAMELVEDAIRIDGDPTPIESFTEDPDTVGFVLVENRFHPGNEDSCSLDDATDLLNASGYTVSTILRDREPVASLSISRRGLGEASTKTYGLEVRPMVTGDIAVLRRRLSEIEQSTKSAADRLDRLDGENLKTTRELGQALARMRKHEGWLEAERSNTMERRAIAAEGRLSEIETSWTWRIGSVVLWLPQKLASVFGRSSK